MVSRPTFEYSDTLLTGTGTAGEEVQIVVDGEVVGTAEVTSDGTWELTTVLDEAGKYEVSVQTVDADGNVVGSPPKTLVVGDADSPIADAKAPTGDGNAPTVSLPPSGSSSAGEITLRGYRETNDNAPLTPPLTP